MLFWKGSHIQLEWNQANHFLQPSSLLYICSMCLTKIWQNGLEQVSTGVNGCLPSIFLHCFLHYQQEIMVDKYESVAFSTFFMVPRSYHCLGSKVMFGKRPIYKVAGYQADIDSLSNTYTTFKSFLHLALNLN